MDQQRPVDAHVSDRAQKTTAPAVFPAASKCSCRTARRPDRPRPSPFDCAGRAKGSTP